MSSDTWLALVGLLGSLGGAAIGWSAAMRVESQRRAMEWRNYQLLIRADTVRWRVACESMAEYNAHLLPDRGLRWTDVVPGLVHAPAGFGVIVLQNYFDREIAESAMRDLMESHVNNARELLAMTFELHRSAAAAAVLLDWMADYAITTKRTLRSRLTRPWRSHRFHKVTSPASEAALRTQYQKEIQRRLSETYGYRVRPGGGLDESMHTPEKHADLMRAYTGRERA